MTDMSQLLDTILNLSKYHREHEKFYAKSPLECAIQLQKASGILKTLAGPRNNPDYLFSASELLDRAADLAIESAALVHENERRWRVFRTKVQEVAGETAEINTRSNTIGEPNANNLFDCQNLGQSS